ncbi:MAG: hypothetical protein ACI37R_05765 [Candidatus Avigastranaerophilus sp.]
MRKKHLKLVVSNSLKSPKRLDFKGVVPLVCEHFKFILTPKREKIYVLKDSLIKLYRDYEITTGICEIPYYIRAELKISEIIQDNKVDYYFKIMQKIRKNSLE